MRTTGLAAVLLASSLGFAQDPEPSGKSGADLIDHWIRAKWKDSGLKAEGRAGDAEYLRRVCLDITGTIPPLELTERFLADKTRDKRRQLVDELLAGDRYATNWAEIWAGTLVGFDDDGRTQQAYMGVAKQLKEVFKTNPPYDQFVRDIITAEGQTNYGDDKPQEEQNVNGVTYFFFRLQRSAGRETPEALAGKFSRTFLGTQIQCAQCHDHPFDVWTQEDFYGMASFFADTQIRRVKNGDQREYWLVNDRPARPRGPQGLKPADWKGSPIKPAFLESKEAPQKGEVLRAAFARMTTSKDNLQFARATVNRYWGHFFGRGIVDPVDEFNARNRPSHPELLDELARDFVAHNFDLKWLIREIVLSDTYQLTSAGRKYTPEIERLFARSQVRAMTPEQILASVLTALAGDAMTADDARKERAVRGLIRDFRYAFGDDEGNETVEFSGTIPGALLMMNSEIISAGVSAAAQRRGVKTRLSLILAKSSDPVERVESIYLATLSRTPSREERNRAVQWLATKKNAATAYEDLLWSLVNSSEFLFNH